MWPVRSNNRPRRHRSGHRPGEFAAEPVLEQSNELLDAHCVEHVFQSRLGAIGAISALDVEPHHGVRHDAGVLRLHEHSGFAGKIAMAGNAAQAKLEPDARRKPETVIDANRGEADVVGVLQDGNGAGAVEGDVELAR